MSCSLSSRGTLPQNRVKGHYWGTWTSCFGQRATKRIRDAGPPVKMFKQLFLKQHPFAIWRFDSATKKRILTPITLLSLRVAQIRLKPMRFFKRIAGAHRQTTRNFDDEAQPSVTRLRNMVALSPKLPWQASGEVRRLATRLGYVSSTNAYVDRFSKLPIKTVQKYPVMTKLWLQNVSAKTH